MKQQRAVRDELTALLTAIQTGDGRTIERLLAPLSPPQALQTLLEICQALQAQGRQRRRFLWLLWAALTLLFLGGCSPCVGFRFDWITFVVLLGWAAVLSGIVTWLVSLASRPNFRSAQHCLEITLLRVEGTVCVPPLLALAAQPGLRAIQTPLWRSLAHGLSRLPDSDLEALTPEQRRLLARNAARHGKDVTVAILLVFTSLRDPALKSKGERWLRSSDERLQEAARDYLKALE